MRIPSRRPAKAPGARAHLSHAGLRPGFIEKAGDPRRALGRLAGYLSCRRGALGLVLGLVLGYTLLSLLEPYLIGVAIDSFITARKVQGLAALAGLLLGIYVLDDCLQAAAGWIMAGVSQDALRRLRRDLFGHLQTLPLGFFDTHPAGELMSRLTNDIEAVNQAVSQNVVALLAGVLSLAGILITMFVLNAWLASACLVVVPVLFWFTHFVSSYTRKGFRLLQGELAELNAEMEESISGQRVVMAFRRGDAAAARFREANERVCRAGEYANTYALMLMPLTNVLGNLFVIVLAGLGGFLALKGLATVGLIAAFIGYARNFIHPLRQLANMYNSIQAALAGAERVFEIIDTPAEPDAPEGAAPLGPVRGEVRFEDVRFGYHPDREVIKGMSLEARAGSTIALVGPTGAGKTTIINLLTRFYELKKGRITVDGRDLRGIPKAELRRSIALVLQDTFLFADTVMANIRYGRLDAADAECVEAAKLADADHFIRLLPQGYETRLSERAGDLSEGQRQLLAIARAILADPGILILDEATSSVDTRTEARIQKGLLRLMRGRTSFVIAHRLSTIRDADEVIVIDDGAIVERGSHQELLQARGLYRRLYMSQFRGQAI